MLLIRIQSKKIHSIQALSKVPKPPKWTLAGLNGYRLNVFLSTGTVVAGATALSGPGSAGKRVAQCLFTVCTGVLQLVTSPVFLAGWAWSVTWAVEYVAANSEWIASVIGLGIVVSQLKNYRSDLLSLFTQLTRSITPVLLGKGKGKKVVFI